MEQQYLNFDRNFNHKLQSVYFTTIRNPETVNEKHLEPGMVVIVKEGRVPVFYAEIIEIKSMRLNCLSRIEDILISVDTGRDWLSAQQKLREICGGDTAAIILLRRIIGT